MKYLYTTKPDEHCHEVEPGIYGRPAQTSEQAKLRKLGWVYHISDLKGDDHVREEKEGRQEEVEVSRSIYDAQLASLHDEAEVVKLDDCDISEEDKQNIKLNMLRRDYEAKFGKPPHHKMKAETIRKKLDESDD